MPNNQTTMEMKKATLSQLFKEGKSFSFKKIDFTSNRISNEIRKIKHEQVETLKSAEVDLNDLKKIVFTV